MRSGSVFNNRVPKTNYVTAFRTLVLFLSSQCIPCTYTVMLISSRNKLKRGTDLFAGRCQTEPDLESGHSWMFGLKKPHGCYWTENGAESVTGAVIEGDK